MLGDEQPNDELNTAPKAGLHFGYPYCHEGTISDPEFGAKRPCSEFAGPAARLGPHVAALGLKFYTGTQFPAEYRKQLFIVNHGSWNRSANVSHTGYRLMIAKLKDNKVVSYEPFIEGWLQNGRQSWGRPVDLLVLPDGSMLVSDDRANVIYRITSRGLGGTGTGSGEAAAHPPCLPHLPPPRHLTDMSVTDISVAVIWRP